MFILLPEGFEKKSTIVNTSVAGLHSCNHKTVDTVSSKLSIKQHKSKHKIAQSNAVLWQHKIASPAIPFRHSIIKFEVVTVFLTTKTKTIAQSISTKPHKTVPQRSTQQFHKGAQSKSTKEFHKTAIEQINSKSYLAGWSKNFSSRQEDEDDFLIFLFSSENAWILKLAKVIFSFLSLRFYVISKSDRWRWCLVHSSIWISNYVVFNSVMYQIWVYDFFWFLFVGVDCREL